MTAVTKYFFTALYDPPNRWSVVRWWESRRLVYNMCVGGAGLVSVGVGALLAALPPAPLPSFMPWGAAVVFGVLANVGYTLGPVVDLLLRKVLAGRAAAIGPVLFRYGFVFSMGLALLPIPVFALGWILRFVLP